MRVSCQLGKPRHARPTREGFLMRGRQLAITALVALGVTIAYDMHKSRKG